MLFLDESGAWLLVGDIQLDAYHQTSSTNIHHMGKVHVLQLCHDVLAHLGCILHEV